jgi:hypothetical protein
VRGDGFDQRHVEFLLTELCAFFDELFHDDKVINEIGGIERGSIEESYAKADRGMVEMGDYLTAKTKALQQNSIDADDLTGLPYSELLPVVSALIFNICSWNCNTPQI